MAKGIKYKFTVDAFKVCYLANEDTINFLNNITYEDDFYNNFKLHRLEGAGLIYDNVIVIQVQNPNTMEWMSFGKLCYTEKRHNDEGSIYVWFEVDNKVFYTPLYKNMNILVFINDITEELELVDNNITTLDIAMDSNVNFAKRIKRAISNKNLVPIVNRKQYDDEREQIKGVRFNYGTNQVKLLDLAIYIKQNTKEGGFELKGYDKGKEIEISQKEYIQEWLDMEKPFRLEVHLKKEHVIEFCDRSNKLHLAFGNEKVSPSMLISFIANSDNELLGQMFLAYANRLIKFRNKTTGEELSIFEV